MNRIGGRGVGSTYKISPSRLEGSSEEEEKSMGCLVKTREAGGDPRICGACGATKFRRGIGYLAWQSGVKTALTRAVRLQVDKYLSLESLNDIM